MKRRMHAVFQRDGDWYIARCLTLPVTSQGATIEEAKANIREAVDLYLETWGPDDIQELAEQAFIEEFAVTA